MRSCSTLQFDPLSRHEGKPSELGLRRPELNRWVSYAFRSHFLSVAAPGLKLTQTEAESRIRAAGISIISSGNCSNKSNPRCTSLNGILSSTVDGIIALKRASGASITITGGTEVGHAAGTRSHANGSIMDAPLNSLLTRLQIQG